MSRQDQATRPEWVSLVTHYELFRISKFREDCVYFKHQDEFEIILERVFEAGRESARQESGCCNWPNRILISGLDECDQPEEQESQPVEQRIDQAVTSAADELDEDGANSIVKALEDWADAKSEELDELAQPQPEGPAPASDPIEAMPKKPQPSRPIPRPQMPNSSKPWTSTAYTPDMLAFALRCAITEPHPVAINAKMRDALGKTIEESKLKQFIGKWSTTHFPWLRSVSEKEREVFLTEYTLRQRARPAQQGVTA